MNLSSHYDPERRVSKAYQPPKVELVQEDDGRHAYKCTPHSSPFEDSDSAASGLSRRGGGKHPRKKRRKWLVDGFMVAGGVMSALLLTLACFTFFLGDWVLTGLAELLGFFSLLGGAYLGSSVLYSLWSTQCTHSVPLDSRTVALMAGGYVVGAACCNLVDLLLPSLPLEATFLLLLAGWLSATNAFLHKDTVTPDQFIQRPESYLLVAATLAHRVVVQAVFRAFIPAFLLPLIVHSCHLFGLTVALVMQGGRNRPISREVSSLSVNKRRHSLRSSVLYPPPLRVGARHSSLERKSSWTSVSSIASSRITYSDTDQIVEARGILSDLMLEKGLEGKTLHRLEKVKSLLTPSTLANAPIVTKMKPMYTTMDSGVQDGHLDPPALTHRSSVFAVGTSSTGMPLLPDSPLKRPRAPARNEFPRPHLKEEKTRPPLQHRPSLPVLSKAGQRISGTGDMGSVGTSPLVMSRSHSALDKEIEEESREVEEEEEDSDDEPVFATDAIVMVACSDATASPSTTPQVTVTDGESKESAAFPATTSGSGSNALPPQGETREPPSSKSSLDSVTNQMHKVSLSSLGDLHARKFSTEQAKKYSIFSKFQMPDLQYDITDYSECSIDMVVDLGTWDFPIFRFAEESMGHPLSQMAYQVFIEMGLMETFHIAPRPFINFFRALELNYGVGACEGTSSITDHNNRHAADVLHATFYLLTEPIPEFEHQFHEDGSARIRVESRKCSSVAGNLASAFSVLEVLGCLLAAACHDFDHPGKTNAFLTATRNPLATLYNDRSVLENHHAAASWEMLTTEPEMNFLESLDQAEYKRLRFLFIECILATDLKMHFSMVAEFRNKYVQSSSPIDWQSEEERMGIMEMLIKMADINGPSKCEELHLLWTECITEEFYQQDEEEHRLGLPSTMFLQRGANPEQLPKVQLSFVQNLVAPLFHVCAEMGIIPGEVSYEERSPSRSASALEMAEAAGTSDRYSVTAVMGDVSNTSDDDEGEGHLRKFTSIILDNLQSNIDSWQAKLDAAIAAQSGAKEMDTPSIAIEDVDVEDGDVEDNDHDPDA